MSTSLCNRPLRYATGGDAKRLDAFEAEAWTGVLALGRALMVLFLARQAARPRATGYVVDGVSYVLRGERTSRLGTRFGKVSLLGPWVDASARLRPRLICPLIVHSLSRSVFSSSQVVKSRASCFQTFWSGTRVSLPMDMGTSEFAYRSSGRPEVRGPSWNTRRRRAAAARLRRGAFHGRNTAGAPPSGRPKWSTRVNGCPEARAPASLGIEPSCTPGTGLPTTAGSW